MTSKTKDDFRCRGVFYCANGKRRIATIEMDWDGAYTEYVPAHVIINHAGQAVPINPDDAMIMQHEVFQFEGMRMHGRTEVAVYRSWQEWRQ